MKFNIYYLSKKEHYFCVKEFFENLDLKNQRENGFENNNERKIADQEIGYPTKSTLNPFGLSSLIRQRGS